MSVEGLGRERPAASFILSAHGSVLCAVCTVYGCTAPVLGREARRSLLDTFEPQAPPA
jgi:hypothetical protein